MRFDMDALQCVSVRLRIHMGSVRFGSQCESFHSPVRFGSVRFGLVCRVGSVCFGPRTWAGAIQLRALRPARWTDPAPLYRKANFSLVDGSRSLWPSVPILPLHTNTQSLVSLMCPAPQAKWNDSGPSQKNTNLSLVDGSRFPKPGEPILPLPTETDPVSCSRKANFSRVDASRPLPKLS